MDNGPQDIHSSTGSLANRVQRFRVVLNEMIVVSKHPGPLRPLTRLTNVLGLLKLMKPFQLWLQHFVNLE